MKSIPRETNNIICMSMIRGVPPSKLVGHGSLWLQVRWLCACVVIKCVTILLYALN